MGEVYLARDTRLQRDVAVKVLPAAFAESPERLQRFEQEARATATLNHPNVMQVFDVGVDSGVPYVVLELLEGETLAAALSEGALAPRTATDLAGQIARAWRPPTTRASFTATSSPRTSCSTKAASKSSTSASRS